MVDHILAVVVEPVDLWVLTALRLLKPTKSLPCLWQIQGGDTAEKTGVKGGESIWGPTSFPDEFHPDNIHDKVGSSFLSGFFCPL